MKRIFGIILAGVLFCMCGCSNNSSGGNLSSQVKKLDADYTGLWQHTEYQDSYSAIIYKQDGNKIDLVVSAQQGGSYGRMISIRKEGITVNSAHEAIFDYQDTNGNTGNCHLLLKGETIFLGFSADKPYKGGFCIDAANGDFMKTKEFSEMDYFDAQEYGVDEIIVESTDKNIPHGKEIKAMDIVDYTVYYEMIGNDKYNENNALHFRGDGIYEREHGGNTVEEGNYIFYESDNSEYDFMLSRESNQGKYQMFYGKVIKEKDIIELYEYIPDYEYPISWCGRYITQVYAHNRGKMVR